MIELNSNLEPTTPPAAKPRRTRKPETKPATTPPATKPATKRTRKPTDPRILVINEKAALDRAVVKAEDASARQLRVIREKRLPKLTPQHRHELYLDLCKTETPSFPSLLEALADAQAPAASILDTQHQPAMQNEGQA